VSPTARAEAPRSILVVRLGAVGDVIRTLPAVSCMRRTWPGARIGWAVEEPSRDLLEGHPDVDQVHVLARRSLGGGAGPARLLRAVRLLRAYAESLRREPWEWAVDLQGTFKSALVSRMSGAGRIFGFGPGHSRERAHLFYTDTLPLPRRRLGRVERALASAALLGADVAAPRRLLPERPEAAKAVEPFLSARAAARPRILISPGTSEAQSFKRYPWSHFAALADALIERTGGSVILAWGPGEESIVEAVRGSMRHRAVPTPRTSLPELVELARRCDLFIGSDTGPHHLAAAAGIPVVAIYGPTDAVVNAPWGDRPHRSLSGDVACSPCRNRGCRSQACLRRIDPLTVAAEAAALLRTAGALPR
jgi:lipopolysaccharide heptosyltransferase I